jgi:hypothetical protein
MDILARNWGWIALRGVAALVFGLLTLLYPKITMVTLVLLFGAYALRGGSARLHAVDRSVRGGSGDPAHRAGVPAPELAPRTRPRPGAAPGLTGRYRSAS